MHLAHALQLQICKSLCAWNFLSCLTCILLKRKFIPQASRQCQRALDPHTDWPTPCYCLFVACLHLKCYCDSDSTKVATIQQPRRWPKRSSPLQDPRKRLWICFFFWISHCQLCELWRPGGNIQRCLREQVSPRWNPEVRSRSYSRDTGAVLVQRAVRMLNAKSREERINLELGLCELLLGSTVLSRDWFFFSSVLTGRERERERERERVDRTYRWRKFRFQWLSRQSEERQESLEVQVRGAWSGKAHRSVSTSLERTDRDFPAVYF